MAIGPTILTGEEDKCKKVAIIIPSIEAYGEYGLETKIKELVEKYKPTEISIINQGKGMMAKYYTGSFVTERARLHAHLHIAEREYDEIRKYLEEKKIAFYD